MSTISATITKTQYEIVSWSAVFELLDADGKKLSATVNLERLREIVAAADKDWALLVAKEGGAA